ncbi:MAG TPA: hypothetical protein VGP97_04990 [Burkholderiales bacterium]|nr:hypothetical protein [Burkholderiales bacterium]
MADELDPKVSRRYRELSAEEPPRELDQAILAAAHRSADRPHAPLVAPVGRHRWYFAFGAAAILMLAVAVTVQVERQQPDPEALAVASMPEERKEAFSDAKEPPAAKEQRRETDRAEPPRQIDPSKPPSGPARNAVPLEEKPRAAELARADRLEAQQQKAPSIETQSAPAAAPAAPAPSTQTQSQDQSPGAAAGLQESRVVASAAPPLSPERLLERIAELRKEGRHDEANKALAEFRKQYPDYRISEEMLKKVERPK